MIKNILSLLFACFVFTINAQPDIDFMAIAGNFERPVDITGAGDGSNRLFVVEKPGRIKIIDLTTNTVLAADFLNIEASVDDASNEQGLLGLAFHPNFALNGTFYVNYIYDPGPGLDRTRVSRFRVSGNPNVASSGSETIILEIEQDFSNHNGGDLNFGPDGYLYIGMGDGGSANDPNCRAQDPAELLGKMLRIDVNSSTPANMSGMCGLVKNYGIPPSNPFANPNDGICDEIWAVGVRNPWRFSFDSQTGDMWIGDVGQNDLEEIDFQAAGSPGGENYGWKIMEGTDCFDSDPIDPDCPSGVPSCFDASFVAPAFEFSHNLGCSVTGGFVYRGSQSPGLYGYYVFMDYCSNRIWTLTGIPGAWSSTVKTLGGYGNISTFGQDDNNELYAANDAASASVYKVFDILTVGVDLIEFKGKLERDKVQLNWQAANPVNFSHFEIEKSHNAANFNFLGKVKFKQDDHGQNKYQFVDQHPVSGDNFYRLKMVDQDGAIEYSNTINIPYNIKRLYHLYPNPVQDILYLDLLHETSVEILSVDIFNSSGQKVWESNSLKNVFGEYPIHLNKMNSGIYLIRINTEAEIIIQKFYKE